VRRGVADGVAAADTSAAVANTSALVMNTPFITAGPTRSHSEWSPSQAVACVTAASPSDAPASAP
jgi:hypothetical protein